LFISSVDYFAAFNSFFGGFEKYFSKLFFTLSLIFKHFINFKMTMFKLDDELSFAIERCEKRARLIVYKNGVENVCRKETFGNLKRFVESNRGHIFKGRLQLNKNGESVGVEVKGKLIGIIKAEEFLGCLKEVDQ
jgi:hypothetical protein